MPEESQKRQVAVKLRVGEILGGKYVVEEGWNPNYVLTKDGRKASRVNLLGVVISNPTVEVNYRTVMLDDGSGSISVRSFDEADMFRGISLGDAVFVIGRPRQYGNEVYIMPEIAKKVENRLWIEVRKRELEKLSGKAAAENASPDAPAAESSPRLFHSASEERVIDEDVAEEPPEDHAGKTSNEEQSPQQKVFSLIKELDKGDGALFEEILEKSGLADAEKIISRLLMEGEIFELGKGKLKVLE